MVGLVNFFLIILISLASIAANSLLRIGLKKIPLGSLSPSYLAKNIFHVVLNPPIILGVAIFASGALLWFRVLTQEPLGKSYPVFVGFTIVFLILSSYFVLKEPLTFAKVGGMFLIIAGTFLAFRV